MPPPLYPTLPSFPTTACPLVPSPPYLLLPACPHLPSCPFCPFLPHPHLPLLPPTMDGTFEFASYHTTTHYHFTTFSLLPTPPHRYTTFPWFRWFIVFASFIYGFTTYYHLQPHFYMGSPHYVDALFPRRFVDVGTITTFSFCWFCCQVVWISTQCFPLPNRPYAQFPLWAGYCPVPPAPPPHSLATTTHHPHACYACFAYRLHAAVRHAARYRGGLTPRLAAFIWIPARLRFFLPRLRFIPTAFYLPHTLCRVCGLPTWFLPGPHMITWLPFGLPCTAPPRRVGSLPTHDRYTLTPFALPTFRGGGLHAIHAAVPLRAAP